MTEEKPISPEPIPKEIPEKPQPFERIPEKKEPSTIEPVIVPPPEKSND